MSTRIKMPNTSRSASSSKTTRQSVAPKDMVIQCRICKSKFYFTVSEQKYYKDNNLNIPTKCKSCRDRIKQKKEISNTPKACGTCYFGKRISRTWRGETIYCTFNNRKRVGEKPCENWQRQRSD